MNKQQEWNGQDAAAAWDRVYESCRQIIASKFVTDPSQEELQEKAFVVVIDGMCGSGKSTVASRLQEHFGGSLFHMDDYFLRPHQRTPERLAEPGGNVDYERFRQEIYDHLNDREGLYYQRFDCKRMLLQQPQYVARHRLVLIEGAYSCHPYFGERQDLRIFLEGSREGQLDRLADRNGSEKLKQFQERWIPMEERYFEAFGIRDKCVCINVDTIHDLFPQVSLYDILHKM